MSAPLLHRATAYALDAVDTVTPDLLSRPTPCSDWDLGMLLSHTCASLDALCEAVDVGRVGLFAADERAPADPARAFRERVSALCSSWDVANDDRSVAVADHELPISMLSAVAVVEIAVHGWDVFQATGQHRPIPAQLAADLLPLSKQLLAYCDRRGLFAAPLPARDAADPGEALLAFLGRPTWGVFPQTG